MKSEFPHSNKVHMFHAFLLNTFSTERLWATASGGMTELNFIHRNHTKSILAS